MLRERTPEREEEELTHTIDQDEGLFEFLFETQDHDVVGPRKEAGPDGFPRRNGSEDGDQREETPGPPDGTDTPHE